MCFANDRDRLVWLFLEERLKISSQDSVTLLHVAPERQLQRRLQTRQNVTYFAGDRLVEGYTYAAQTIPLDIMNLPFRSAVFDIVICNHVLEHVTDDLKAMHELYRVTKPGCVAILQVPILQGAKITYEDTSINTPEARERVYGQNDHRRLYGDDYGERLKSAGFQLQRNRFHLEMSEDMIRREGLNPHEEIFAAQRPLAE